MVAITTEIITVATVEQALEMEAMTGQTLVTEVTVEMTEVIMVGQALVMETTEEQTLDLTQIQIPVQIMVLIQVIA